MRIDDVTDSYDINEYLHSLKSSRKFGPQIVCQRTLPERAEEYSRPTFPLPDSVVHGLKTRGINELYSHQAEALNIIRQKEDIIIATPTASGKSLIYNLPVLEHYGKNADFHALYLFPLKALAQDQLRGLRLLHSAVCSHNDFDKTEFAAIYDGDTTSYRKRKIREQTPPVLITNPDMLHLSLLPYHDSWSGFFKNLKFVVIDEVHTYRGLFGSHMSWILRRLIRVARYYGSTPQFILLSATIGNPEQLGRKLIGKSLRVLDQTGAPVAKKHIVFLNPWDSAAHAASQLLEAALKRNLRTIVYTKSRKMTELITMWTKPRLGDRMSKLSSYRAGFLPEERRVIEHDLSSGKLLGVISTSALELGIDIGDLDLCILVGYPGSIMATWQRSGRVGRGVKESAVVLIGGEDALDQHFMRNPDDFFSRNAENAPLNPLNSRITQLHLHCAAAERPLSTEEPLVANSRSIQKEIANLTEKAIIYQERSGHHWYASRKMPQRLVNLRGGGRQLCIIETKSGEIIGEIDAGRALKETHQGAIYLHRSETLLVHSLDLQGKEVLVNATTPRYYTRPIVKKHTQILEKYESKVVFGCRVSWGRLQVTEKVTGYQKVNNFTSKTISTESLDLPEQVIETEGLWMDLQETFRQQAEGQQMHFMGAIHAIEHAMIAMFPLVILCDRNDIGGISCPHHEQTGLASIFIYDGFVGGAGLSEEAYGIIDKLLRQTEKTVTSCPCDNGCPSCVHSPKCGSGNRPIDKAASLYILQQILSTTPHSGSYDNGTLPLQTLPDLQSAAQPQKIITSSPQNVHPNGIKALPPNYCVFDLETKLSAQEVGGWSRADRMGMSVGVVFDSVLDGFVTYLEEDAAQMVEHLSNSQLIIGFNNKRFDNQVLSAYSDIDLHKHVSLDLLEEIHARLGYRLSLDRVAEQTLGTIKSANGLQALKWYKEGKIKKIVSYCKKDVEITRNLLLFGLENGFLLFKNKAGSIVRLPLSLDVRLTELLS